MGSNEITTQWDKPVSDGQMRFERGGAIRLLKNLMTLIYMAGGRGGAGGPLIRNEGEQWEVFPSVFGCGVTQLFFSFFLNLHTLHSSCVSFFVRLAQQDSDGTAWSRAPS